MAAPRSNQEACSAEAVSGTVGLAAATTHTAFELKPSASAVANKAATSAAARAAERRLELLWRSVGAGLLVGKAVSASISAGPCIGVDGDSRRVTIPMKDSDARDGPRYQ